MMVISVHYLVETDLTYPYLKARLKRLLIGKIWLLYREPYHAKVAYIIRAYNQLSRYASSPLYGQLSLRTRRFFSAGGQKTIASINFTEGWPGWVCWLDRDKCLWNATQNTLKSTSVETLLHSIVCGGIRGHKMGELPQSISPTPYLNDWFWVPAVMKVRQSTFETKKEKERKSIYIAPLYSV